MDRGNIYGKMAVTMTVTGNRLKSMGSGCTFGQMEESTRVNG